MCLQKPLAETRAVCSKLGTLQLQHLAAGQTYTLQSFLTSQHAWQQEVALELEDCNESAAEATAEACQAALAALAERLEQFHSKQVGTYGLGSWDAIWSVERRLGRCCLLKAAGRVLPDTHLGKLFFSCFHMRCCSCMVRLQETVLAKTEKTLAPLHEAAGRNITLHTAGLHSTQKAQVSCAGYFGRCAGLR